MSMLDKLKNMMKGHEDTVHKGVDKGGDMIDEKTGGKYSGHVDTAQQKINEQYGTPSTPGEEHPPQP